MHMTDLSAAGVVRWRRPPSAWAWLVAGVLAVGGSGGAWARDFQAEGVDAGGGLGARHIAMGGTGLSFADDVHAAYYNPAGLSDVRGLELTLSRQLDARLHPFNHVGMAWRLPPEWSPGGARITVAGVFYPRIHARANGAYAQGDVESVFLRYLLPGINGTFDGRIDSKTKTWRLAIGVSPAADSRWAFGGYVDRIDCRSEFCGVHATSNGFTVQSTGAKAWGYGLGIRYSPNETWTWAATVSDIRTQLDVQTITTDAAGTRTRDWSARFPRKVAAEGSMRFGAGWRAAAGYEITRGDYGSNRIDIQALRAGVEREDGPWRWRAGALVPLRIASADTGRLSLPAPLSPTVGLGWRKGLVEWGLAVYAHPLMSLHEDRPSPTADLSLTLRF